METKPPVDNTFTGNIQIEYWLQILENDFEKTNAIFENATQDQAIDSGCYLNDFSDSELVEIIEKFNEWSKLDLNFSCKDFKKERKTD